MRILENRLVRRYILILLIMTKFVAFESRNSCHLTFSRYFLLSIIVVLSLDPSSTSSDRSEFNPNVIPDLNV